MIHWAALQCPFNVNLQITGQVKSVTPRDDTQPDPNLKARGSSHILAGLSQVEAQTFWLELFNELFIKYIFSLFFLQWMVQKGSDL